MPLTFIKTTFTNNQTGTFKSLNSQDISIPRRAGTHTRKPLVTKKANMTLDQVGFPTTQVSNENWTNQRRSQYKRRQQNLQLQKHNIHDVYHTKKNNWTQKEAGKYDPYQSESVEQSVNRNQFRITQMLNIADKNFKVAKT